MTRARRQQIALSQTPYYHCISRCVRRAFLCGYDRYADRDYEHRREWVRARLAQLVDVFAIDLCAYAILSNHYHVVLRVDRDQSVRWSSREVAARWTTLFGGPAIIWRFLEGNPLDDYEKIRIAELTDTWRERLSDISWFMRALNEHIARTANSEDRCKGRFWEDRFKSQALLDERAVLACMAYVDLNPVRAGIAETPETSDYTSVQQRAQALARPPKGQKETVRPRLAPMANDGSERPPSAKTICGVRFTDYLELVDRTGRCLRKGKRGTIAPSARPILDRLGIEHDAWMHHMAAHRTYLARALGATEAIRQFAEAIGQRWLWGVQACRGLCER